MKMTCPHCGVSGSANDSLLGKKVRCPKCTKVFIVEEDIAQVSPAAPEEPLLTETQDEQSPVDIPSTNETGEETILADHMSKILDSAEDSSSLEALPTVPCDGCGEEFHPDFLQEVDRKLYCGICHPEPLGEENEADLLSDNEGTSDDFTVGEILSEAWQKTKGAKASIWAGLIVMILTIAGLSIGAGFLIMPDFSTPEQMPGTQNMVINGVLQVVIQGLNIIFSAGLLYMGVSWVRNREISWKMIFSGFPRIVSIIAALILQTIIIVIGFCLLIIPGIYLSVGYLMTLPLIIDKGLGPWEALERSRKAIHKKWWTVFGVYLSMILIYIVSALPLGIGLIWTIPMFMVAAGVVYCKLFGGSEELAE